MKHFSLLMVFLLSCLWYQAAAQDRTISGRVTDRSSGQGLPGVTVLAKGTTVGTSTNADGAFSLSGVPATATELTFSFIGYTTITQAIGRGNNISVALATDSKQLGEVVVTGALGIQRQAQEIGYATATLDTKEVTQARPTNVTNGLAGKVSGLQIQTLSSGVNPQVRVTLRGTRSVTGDNQALIVIDGVISTNEVLTSINPDDVANISVLKGANAAALYGSQASNGALIITTKKGSNTPQITFSHTSQFESLSFLPKFQSQFGPGANVYNNELRDFRGDSVDTDYKTRYQGFENQQYGPRFDGSLRPFGEKLANGDQQFLTYNARPDEKRKFFNSGYQTQNGVTFSGGDEKTKFFASYQNVHNNGIVPKDKYDRNSFRFNASRELGSRLTVGFNVSYVQAKIDATSNLDRDNSVYWNIFNTTVMAPVTAYKNWQTDEYANPNGYYNAFYFNPYFILDNNRQNDRRNTLLGNIDLSYKVRDWLRVQYRLGTTNIDQSSLTTQNRFVYNPYVIAGNTNKAGTTVPGFVQDLSSNLNRINSDLFVSVDKTFGDVSVRAILGNNVQQLKSRYSYAASNGLAVADIFNLQNRTGEATVADANYTTQQYSFYADLTLGYKDFFFLHGSGRNDNVSTLDPGNRSFFYPGVDASLIFSNAIPALKDASFLDYGKIRGGITKVSQINLGTGTGFGVAQTGGAYATNSVFGLGGGFPYGGLTSFSAGNSLVVPGLKPEETLSTEGGIELSFLKRRVSAGFTYYSQKSTNQTIQGSIPRSTGYSNLLLNAGEVRNNGYEIDLNLTPIRTENGLTVTIGANYNYNNNQIVALLPTVRELPLTTGGNANVFATEGQSFPTLRGSYYQRTADGRIQMTTTTDPNTGAVRYVPIKAADTKIFGNTLPKNKYGFNASVSYKGLTLAGQGEYRTGYVVYHTIGENLDFSGGSARSVSQERLDFVMPNSAISNDGGATYVPNTVGLTPGGSEFWASAAYNTGVAENYVTKGDFFKIREMSLSYAVPAAMLTKSGFVKGVSLSVYGRNLYTWVPKENQWTDPEFSFGNSSSNAVGINTVNQTPPTKFYGASLNATF